MLGFLSSLPQILSQMWKLIPRPLDYLDVRVLNIIADYEQFMYKTVQDEKQGASDIPKVTDGVIKAKRSQNHSLFLSHGKNYSD